MIPLISKPPISQLKLLPLAMCSVLLVACGGGSGDSGSTTPVSPSSGPQNNEAEVVEILEEPTEIMVKDNVPVIANSNDDDEVTTTPETAIDQVVLDRLNSRRIACDFGALSVSKKLTNAADNHANYLITMGRESTQPFQGHDERDTGIYSGRSNPYFSGLTVQDRIATDGLEGDQAIPVEYDYRALGENLSYLTYNQAYADQNTDEQIALNSINGLLAAPYHLASLVSPNFSQIGISYKTGPVNRVTTSQASVLEMVSGRPTSQSIPVTEDVLSYPCNGVTNTAYSLNNESPNPFGTSRNLRDNPIGQPVYILAPSAVQVTQATMVDASGVNVPLQQLNEDNDPNDKLTNREVILMPLTPLKPETMYTVSYQVSVDDSAVEDKSFWFKTRAQ